IPSLVSDSSQKRSQVMDRMPSFIRGEEIMLFDSNLRRCAKVDRTKLWTEVFNDTPENPELAASTQRFLEKRNLYMLSRAKESRFTLLWSRGEMSLD
ncbi:hypothetical protein AVEN_189698-1, partial [Araneus ventricosus]